MADISKIQVDGTSYDVKDTTARNELISQSEAIGALETYKTSPYILSKIKAHTGKKLGTSYTSAQQTAVANGTFDGMDIGDYWVINGITWRIWDADWYLYKGDTRCTAHHLVIMPDSNLLVADGSTTQFMGSANDTSGGYASTTTGTGADNWNNTYRAQCVSAVASAFGSDHILSHRELLCNAVTSGKPSGWTWCDCSVEIPSEIMMYGSVVWGNYTDGGAGYQVGTAYPQLALAAIDPSRVINRASYWLRDIASDSWFAYVGDHGNATHAGAAHTGEGVRPYFLLH